MWVSLWEVFTTKQEDNNSQNSEHLLVKICRRSFFSADTFYIGYAYFFKNLLDDYYLAPSYLQFHT